MHMEANQWMSSEKRNAFQQRMMRKLKQSSIADWAEMKKIDPERIDKYKEQEDNEHAKAKKLIQPDIFFDESRRHAVIVVMGWNEIRWLCECFWISKIPSQHRENYILDVTNQFWEAYLSRKTDKWIAMTLTEAQCKAKIWDFMERAKLMEQEKNAKIIAPQFKILLPGHW